MAPPDEHGRSSTLLPPDEHRLAKALICCGLTLGGAVVAVCAMLLLDGGAVSSAPDLAEDRQPDWVAARPADGKPALDTFQRHRSPAEDDRPAWTAASFAAKRTIQADALSKPSPALDSSRARTSAAEPAGAHDARTEPPHSSPPPVPRPPPSPPRPPSPSPVIEPDDCASWCLPNIGGLARPSRERPISPLAAAIAAAV